MEQGTDISVEPTLQWLGRRGVSRKRGLRREELRLQLCCAVSCPVQATDGRSRDGDRSMAMEERGWLVLIGLHLRVAGPVNFQKRWACLEVPSSRPLVRPEESNPRSGSLFIRHLG